MSSGLVLGCTSLLLLLKPFAVLIYEIIQKERGGGIKGAPSTSQIERSESTNECRARSVISQVEAPECAEFVILDEIHTKDLKLTEESSSLSGTICEKSDLDDREQDAINRGKYHYTRAFIVSLYDRNYTAPESVCAEHLIYSRYNHRPVLTMQYSHLERELLSSERLNPDQTMLRTICKSVGGGVSPPTRYTISPSQYSINSKSSWRKCRMSPHKQTQLYTKYNNDLSHAATTEMAVKSEEPDNQDATLQLYIALMSRTSEPISHNAVSDISRSISAKSSYTNSAIRTLSRSAPIKVLPWDVPGSTIPRPKCESVLYPEHHIPKINECQNHQSPFLDNIPSNNPITLVKSQGDIPPQKTNIDTPHLEDNSFISSSVEEYISPVRISSTDNCIKPYIMDSSVNNRTENRPEVESKHLENDYNACKLSELIFSKPDIHVEFETSIDKCDADTLPPQKNLKKSKSEVHMKAKQGFQKTTNVTKSGKKSSNISNIASDEPKDTQALKSGYNKNSTLTGIPSTTYKDSSLPQSKTSEEYALEEGDAAHAVESKSPTTTITSILSKPCTVAVTSTPSKSRNSENSCGSNASLSAPIITKKAWKVPRVRNSPSVLDYAKESKLTTSVSLTSQKLPTSKAWSGTPKFYAPGLGALANIGGPSLDENYLQNSLKIEHNKALQNKKSLKAAPPPSGSKYYKNITSSLFSIPLSSATSRTHSAWQPVKTASKSQTLSSVEYPLINDNIKTSRNTTIEVNVSKNIVTQPTEETISTEPPHPDFSNVEKLLLNMDTKQKSTKKSLNFNVDDYSSDSNFEYVGKPKSKYVSKSSAKTTQSPCLVKIPKTSALSPFTIITHQVSESVSNTHNAGNSPAKQSSTNTVSPYHNCNSLSSSIRYKKQSEWIKVSSSNSSKSKSRKITPSTTT